MKTIKLLLLLLISSFALNSLSAQVNVDFDSFVLNDSCYSQEIQFLDSSTNVPMGATYFWDFGDGNTSTMQNPSHWFFPQFTPYTYVVVLSVLVNGNVVGSYTDQIIVGSQPNTISFTYNGSTACSFPQVYLFSGAETNPNNPIVSWDWYINNQYVGSSQNLTYTFSQAGTYSVNLYGYTSAGCFTEYEETITVGSSNIVVGAGHQLLSGDCQGALVDLYSTVSGGVAPYTYVWDWNSGTSNLANPQQEYVLTSVDPNVYLTVTDANGCSASTSIFIQNTFNNLFAQTTTNPASACNQTCDGDLFVNVSGGSLPYTFVLTPGNITQTGTSSASFTGLCAGLYDVIIYDANQCSTVVSDSVYQNGNPITAFSSSTPTSSCSQTCDGTIDVSATGQFGPYVFVLYTPTGAQTQTGFQAVYPNLCVGTYDIEVTDNNGCSTVLTEVIFQDSLSSIIVDATITNGNSCTSSNGCDASATIIATNGVSPYQYSIDGGLTFQTSNVFDSLCAGTYQANVIDANGCTGIYSFFIQGNQSLGMQYQEYYDACDSNSTGGNGSFIQIYAFGGSGSYTYLWSDGSTSSTLQNPSPGTYSVIVTDGNGCTISESFVVPSNQCFTITGNVYVDVNENCIFDSTDYPVQSFVDLTATAGGPWLWIYDYTDANGAYEITAPAGTYFFDINGYNTNNLTASCPGVNYSVTLDANNPNAVVDFFLSPPAPSQDLSVTTYPIYTPTPGFAYKTKVQYCNDGTIPMSGSVEVTYDANLIWMLSGSATANGWPINTYPAPDNHDAVNRVLTFNFSSLAPGECRYLTITYETDPAAGLLPFDPIYMEAVVNPIPGDVTPTNNVAYYVDQVTSSWDPNDKAVYPLGDITIDDNDHSYHIRFQNEGNANATKVVVKDELDANLDLHSLRNVSASHDYIMTVENNNELVFTFNNIQLVPKSVDEEASQGFVAFTLSQDGDLPIGTSIENTAAIYFDFNAAIITNTVVNTIVEKTVGISDIDVLNAMTLYPNPSTGVFALEVNNTVEVNSIKVFDVLGNVILVMPETASSKIVVNLQNSTDGIYFMEVITNQGTALQKLIKKN